MGYPEIAPSEEQKARIVEAVLSGRYSCYCCLEVADEGDAVYLNDGPHALCERCLRSWSRFCVKAHDFPLITGRWEWDAWMNCRRFNLTVKPDSSSWRCRESSCRAEIT